MFLLNIIPMIRVTYYEDTKVSFSLAFLFTLKTITILNKTKKNQAFFKIKYFRIIILVTIKRKSRKPEIYRYTFQKDNQKQAESYGYTQMMENHWHHRHAESLHDQLSQKKRNRAGGFKDERVFTQRRFASDGD